MLSLDQQSVERQYTSYSFVSNCDTKLKAPKKKLMTIKMSKVRRFTVSKFNKALNMCSLLHPITRMTTLDGSFDRSLRLNITSNPKMKLQSTWWYNDEDKIRRRTIKVQWLWGTASQSGRRYKVMLLKAFYILTKPQKFQVLPYFS